MKVYYKLSCIALVTMVFTILPSIKTGILPSLSAAQDNQTEIELHQNGAGENQNSADTSSTPDELDPKYILGRYIIPGAIFIVVTAAIFLWVIVATRKKGSN